MWIMRVNTKKKNYTLEAVPDRYQNLGGRGLTSTLVHDEVNATCHPLGPNNKLIFAPGIVTGTTAPSSGRISAGGKSPLTGTIKESNAGTSWGPSLASLRIKALIFEDSPEDKNAFTGFHLGWDKKAGKPKASFSNVDEYVGKGLYDIFPKIFKKYGKVDVAAIGVSGELLNGNAGIAYNDLKKRPSRFSGRGGLGALMGSKGLKCIIIDSEGAPGVEIQNSDLFNEGRKKLADALMTHDITKPKGALNSYGTAVLINILNEAGGLPTRNFTSGRFEGAAKIAGEAIFEGNRERTGKELYNHGCSPGCIIQCSNTWHDKNGKEIASCVEYESDWSLGANCGVDDLDQIAEMVHLCNNYGLDTIETGTTVAVAMEAGLIPFGDGKRAIEVINEIGKGTPLGRILGSGTNNAATVLGVLRNPTVKGQSIPAYDPRAVKGIGVTYATTTMGADHTAGYTIAPEILSVGGKADPISVEGKAELSRNFQASTAVIDSTGHCLFIAFAILDIASGFQGVIDEVNGVLGTELKIEDAGALGLQIMKVEREFNEAAGFSSAHDRLPEFMTYEALPPHNVVYDVPESVLDTVYAEV
jgi:aldehyde:ferredoxin oxidoreductase